MRLFRKGKKSSRHETEFLPTFYMYIIPQDFGFVPATITYRIIDEFPHRVDFQLVFHKERDLYTLYCQYYINDRKYYYRSSVQCGI